MKRFRVWCACAALVAACNDDPQDAGVALDDEDAPFFAVHLSDRESAGVALLNAEGKILVSKYVSSGSALPGLNAALYGDIALPTTPCDPSRLTVIARMGGDYILQIDYATDEASLQIKTHTKQSDGAYQSNPQDLLCLGDGRALLSRYQPNLTMDPPAIDQGDDLVLVDLEAGELKQSISLAALRGEVTTTGADGEVTETVYARPSDIVRLRDYALVGLSRLSPSFKSDGKGMLALVRLSDFEVSKVDLPTLANCGELMPVAGRDDAALVGCAGTPFGDAATAGVAILAVNADGEVDVETVFQADDSLPVLYAGIVSLGGTRALVLSQDYVNKIPDTAYDVDLASGTATEVFQAKETGDLGSGWFNAAGKLLMVPDADVGVRRFSVQDDGLEELDAERLSAALPARSVRPTR